MTTIEIIILAIAATLLAITLIPLFISALAEWMNPTPRSANNGPRFHELNGVVIHHMYDYQVK